MYFNRYYKTLKHTKSIIEEAYILCGGQSKRMGQDKALVSIHGKPMIEYVIEVAQKVTNKLYLVGNKIEYKDFGCPIISDLVTNKGPMGGIFTALKNANSPTILILSCDIPFISTKTLHKLIESIDGQNSAFLLKTNKGLQPLAGVYKKELIPELEEHLKQNELKLKSFINNVKAKTVFLENEEEVFNVNNTQELQLITEKLNSENHI